MLQILHCGSLGSLISHLFHSALELNVFGPHLTELEGVERLWALGEAQNDGGVVRKSLSLIPDMGKVIALKPLVIMKGSINSRPDSFVCPSEGGSLIREFI